MVNFNHLESNFLQSNSMIYLRALGSFALRFLLQLWKLWVPMNLAQHSLILSSILASFSPSPSLMKQFAGQMQQQVLDFTIDLMSNRQVTLRQPWITISVFSNIYLNLIKSSLLFRVLVSSQSYSGIVKRQETPFMIAWTPLSVLAARPNLQFFTNQPQFLQVSIPAWQSLVIKSFSILLTSSSFWNCIPWKLSPLQPKNNASQTLGISLIIIGKSNQKKDQDEAEFDLVSSSSLSWTIRVDLKNFNASYYCPRSGWQQRQRIVRRIRKRIEPTKKQLISIMQPNFPKKSRRLVMQASFGFPRFTSVKRKQRLYAGSTSHHPEQLKTDSRNIIVKVEGYVSLSQLRQFSALTVKLLSSSVKLVNPILLRVFLQVSLQLLRLLKQHSQLLPRVSLAYSTVCRMELTVVSEASHQVFKQVGYLIMKAAKMMKMMKQMSIVTEQPMTNLFLFLISPQIPDKLERIIMSEVTMKVAMKPFLKSGRI